MSFPGRARCVATCKTPYNSANDVKLNFNHIYWPFSVAGAGLAYSNRVELDFYHIYWPCNNVEILLCASVSCLRPRLPSFFLFGIGSPSASTPTAIKASPHPPRVLKVLDPSWFRYAWSLWMKWVRAPNQISSSIRARTLVHSLVLCPVLWW